MKVLGVSCSPRRQETTDQLVQSVLAGCDCQTEFISLAGKDIGPCRACLGCVETNECAVQDDMAALREQILGADAYVIGAPTYFRLLNGLAHCFLERFFQFRHREAMPLAGRFGVAVGVGGRDGVAAAQTIQAFFESNQITCIGSVTAQGAFARFTFGYGAECRVGGFAKVFGEREITPSIKPDLAKQPWKVAEAEALGARLVRRLDAAHVKA